MIGKLRASRGFTFIEMVMVIMILTILVGIAIPVYQAQIRASKESVLEHNLATLRDRIDQYKADKGTYPPSLDALVEAGYLREIPEDPMRGSHEWEEIFAEFDPEQPEVEPGVYDVRSFSPEMGMDGRPYSEW
ncbi:MAG: prepilin-type N-terminal cleavage/methylation domain-containing protein [Acidobacteriota bacterium]